MGNSKIIKKVDTSQLTRKNGRIDWLNSIGRSVLVNYDGVDYILKILKYIIKKQKLIVEYDGEEHFINTYGLVNGEIGRIVGMFCTEFRYQNGDVIKIKNKACKIIESYRKDKGYKAYICECQDCFNKKRYSEDNLLRRGFSCNVCSDKISYPERLFGSVISKLVDEYVYQPSFTWCKNIETPIDECVTNKFYDFYIPSINTIVEIHGEIHYEEGRWSKSRSLEYIKLNDEFKKELALKNGISDYIVIDCKESKLEYIKNNILNSTLSKYYNLDNIHWKKCELESSSSLMKRCCDLWNKGTRSSAEISSITMLSKATVITYLKRFSKLGFCDYDPADEKVKGAKYVNSAKKKPLICIETNAVYGCAEDCAKDMFADSANGRFGVTRVCNGCRKSYKGFTFKYIEKSKESELC